MRRATARDPTDSAGLPARLPALELRGAGLAVRLRAPELGSTVLLLVRDAALEAARRYIGALEAQRSELLEWYGRPLIITETADVRSDLPSARLPSREWGSLGVPSGANALLIADRWGEVYLAQLTTTFRDLPDAREVTEWLRYLATQCPECGVIDEPGHGEWAH